MKIGILTFHRAYNYGAVLQAYALCKTIENLGHEFEIIDYGSIGENPRFSTEFRGIKPFLADMYYNLLSLVNADIRRWRFRKFVKQILNVSTERYTKDFQLEDVNNRYDYFITGSDQVWNYNLTNHDKSYLLNFVIQNKKKISYAASFGVSKIDDKYLNDYRTLLKSFNHLSVREKAGKDIISEITGLNSEVVLDPTLLLSGNEWNKIAIPSTIKKPYILCFTIMSDPDGFMSYVRSLSEITGYQIVRIANPLTKLERKVKTIATAGPCEFLGLIKNASIVVTNSFHGTAFSIVYQKPFYTFLYNNDRDIRLKEITEKLGLTYRLVGKNAKLPTKNRINIDYSAIKEKLKTEQEFSLNYLIKAINDN